MITVVARVKAKNGREDDVKGELMALVEPSRRDAGCLGYDLHRSPDDPSLFLFYENWADKEALEAHLGTPHLIALLRKAEEILAEPIQISIWDMLSERA